MYHNRMSLIRSEFSKLTPYTGIPNKDSSISKTYSVVYDAYVHNIRQSQYAKKHYRSITEVGCRIPYRRELFPTLPGDVEVCRRITDILREFTIEQSEDFKNTLLVNKSVSGLRQRLINILSSLSEIGELSYGNQLLKGSPASRGAVYRLLGRQERSLTDSQLLGELSGSIDRISEEVMRLYVAHQFLTGESVRNMSKSLGQRRLLEHINEAVRKINVLQVGHTITGYLNDIHIILSENTEV